MIPGLRQWDMHFSSYEVSASWRIRSIRPLIFPHLLSNSKASSHRSESTKAESGNIYSSKALATLQVSTCETIVDHQIKWANTTIINLLLLFSLWVSTSCPWLTLLLVAHANLTAWNEPQLPLRPARMSLTRKTLCFSKKRLLVKKI